MDNARRMPMAAWIMIAAVLVVGGVLLAIWLGGGGGDDVGEPAGTVTVTQPADADVIPPEEGPPATQPAPVNTQTPSAEPAETIAPERGQVENGGGGATAP